MESDSKSSKLVGGIYPENKVICTNENKLSDSLTDPKIALVCLTMMETLDELSD